MTPFQRGGTGKDVSDPKLFSAWLAKAQNHETTAEESQTPARWSVTEAARSEAAGS